MTYTRLNKSPLPQDLIRSSARDHRLVLEKQRQIAQRVYPLFCRKGFHQTTIREIALACGMSMGQLYHYISSKDDVLFLVYGYLLELWHQRLAKSGLAEIADPLQRLKEALRNTIRFALEQKDLFLLVYTETKYLNKKHLKAVLEADHQQVVGFWLGLVQEAGMSGSSRNMDAHLAANLVSYLMVFLPLRGWDLRKEIKEEHLEQVVEFILKGLGAQGLSQGPPAEG